MSCFLQIMNKTKSKKMNWANSINFDIETERLNYHFTNIYESRIAKTHIWFIIDFMKKKQQNAAIMNATCRHVRWKIQKHIDYKKKCKKYVLSKKRWEYQLMKKASTMFEINWSTDRLIDKVIVMIDSRHNQKLKNYKSILKKKIIKAKKKSQDNDITKKKWVTKESESKKKYFKRKM